MASLFSRIVSGELPAYKVAEDDNYLAFLDIMPVAKGHVLVIPKRETDYIFDMEDADYTGLLLFGKKVAAGMRKAISCKRIGIAVIGLEVPHAHVHLVPLQQVGDINFDKPKIKADAMELEQTAALIRSQINL